ncbi:MAG: hypothetical protein ACETWT_10855, partial [Thermodesulfobacteriota bacterium]
VHGNRGRRPANAIGLALKQRIVALSRTEYASFNDTHFTEKFLIVEGIRISWETVRSIRRRAEILPKRRRRPRRHRFRRAPKSQEGMMVFCDGSAHRGFGAQHPSCCLIVPLMMGLPGGWWPDFSPLSLRRDICGFIHAGKRVDLSSVKEGHIVEIKVRRIPLFGVGAGGFTISSEGVSVNPPRDTPEVHAPSSSTP